jgi:hypothetical protein
LEIETNSSQGEKMKTKGIKVLAALALLFAVNANAQFKLGGNNGGNDHIGWNGGGGNNDGDGWNDGMYVVERQILCESLGQGAAGCATGLERTRSIYLARQISKAACIQGSTYNVYRDRVEVRNGCRAYFVARGLTRYPQASDNIISGGNNGGGSHNGGNQNAGSMDASRPYPIAQNLFSTTVRWQSFAYQGTGVVTVRVVTSQNAGESAEKLFACGKQGQQQANWIRGQDTYVFTLYTGIACPNATYPSYYQLGNAASQIVVRAR